MVLRHWLFAYEENEVARPLRQLPLLKENLYLLGMASLFNWLGRGSNDGKTLVTLESTSLVWVLNRAYSVPLRFLK
jgi:hypothetical protein